jgi:ATP-dependent helicase/nuclease subunit B
MRAHPVASSPANPRRHFLPWDRPLLPQAAEWLAGAWRGDGPLDLGDTVAVVPTRQSGRRLRGALAEFAAARGQAVFPPRVFTPEALVAHGVETDVAAPLDSLLAWAGVCGEADLEKFRDVFPVDPPARNLAWALRLARQLAHLQVTITEAGLGIGDVAARAGDNFPETDRWRQLGELARRHAEALAAHGWRDASAAKIAAVKDPTPLDGVQRIVLVAVADPPPLAIGLLAAHAQACAVEVLVFAPETEAARFDAWGRPIATEWERRKLALPDFERRVHLCGDPAAQAERLVAAAAGYALPDGALAIGLADPEVTPLVAGELARAGLAAFNPEGRPRRAGPFFQLLAALAQLAREPDWPALAALARCPDILAWLEAGLGAAFSAARLLAALDELRAEHLPAGLDAALALGGGGIPELGLLAELRTRLGRGDFPENAASVLTEVFSAMRSSLIMRTLGPMCSARARRRSRGTRACRRLNGGTSHSNFLGRSRASTTSRRARSSSKAGSNSCLRMRRTSRWPASTMASCPRRSLAMRFCRNRCARGSD